MAVLSIQRGQATRQMPRRQQSRMTWNRRWNTPLLLLLLMTALVYLARAEQMFPVNRFEVVGELQHQDPEPVRILLQEFQGEGFFALPIHELKYRLLQLPWVEAASVQRIWPDTVRVRLTEKLPMARWDEDHLLSTGGSVFAAEVTAFDGLPLIHASTHSPVWAMAEFFRLDSAFRQVDERLVALHIDGRAAYQLELASGLVIKLGREQVEKKVSRLISIYQREIVPRKAWIEQLDLRYSNGFAVTWKADTPFEDKASIWSESNV